MRVGVIGCGSAGRRHARNLVSLGFGLVLFDADRPKAVRFGKEIGEVKGRVHVAGSLAEVLEAGVDACVVASPTGYHEEHACAALGRGIPTLIEKPLAVTSEQGRRIVEAASKTEAPTMVGYNLRFLEEIDAAKRSLDTGEIGRALAASFWFGFDLKLWRPGVDYRRTYSADKRLGGGVLLEASHEIDLAYWFFGAVDAVFGSVRRSGELALDCEDLAAAILEMKSGAVVSLFLEMLSPRYRRGFEIVGTRGVISRRWSSPKDFAESYRNEVEYFFRCLQTGERPEPDASDGLYVLSIAEAIASASQNRHPAPVPLTVEDT